MAKLSDKKKTTSFVSAPQSVDKAGFMTETAEDSVPEGWLECSGQVVLQADYPELFAAIGTTYNTGGEAGNEFRLPPNESIGKEDGIAVATGNIGELVQDIQSATINAASSGSYVEIAQVTLSAGVWLVGANIGWDRNGATIVSGRAILGAISTTTASAAGTSSGYTALNQYEVDNANARALSFSNVYLNLSSETTYYLNARTDYSAGTPLFMGSITAVRVA